MNHRSRRLRVFALAVALCGIAAALAATGSTAASPRAALAGSVPSWANSSNFKSQAAASDTVGFRVYLGWRNASQAEALARAVSDPASSSYRQYVSPGQFRQQFAPSQSDVNAVQSWLKAQGFTVDYTPTNNHYVAAEGTVAQAEAAFGATLNEYGYQGQTLRSPSTALSIPSSLASTVSAVIGLDDSQLLTHPDHVVADAPPSAGFRNAPPCSAYWAEKIATTAPKAYGSYQPYAPCGHTPNQLRGAYGVAASGLDGSGQTVAIIDAYASPTIQSDANTYFAKYAPNLSQLTSSNFSQVAAPGTYKRPNNSRQDPSGWYGEETLDVEAVHTMAPGAKIVYVGAPNNYQDLDAALNHVVDRGLAQIVTNSYGFSTESLPSGYIKPYNDTFVQAAAEGIGLYFSSGDDGDETVNGYQSADWPASSPWVTAVGGTSLEVGASNDYLREFGWSTTRSILTGGQWSPALPGSLLYGSGGGVSRLFAEPDYQVNAGINAASFGWPTAGRVIPDVAAIGDPNTGMLVGQTQSFPDGNYWDVYRIGGTSLASPIFAGMMALADQAAGSAHGFANPALYAAGSAAYHDVVDPASPTTGVVRVDYVNGVDAADGLRTSLRTLGFEGTTIHARAGYDDMTGLGSPSASFLSALSH